MKQPNEVVEVRIIEGTGKIYSGYFKDIDVLVKEVSKYNNYNIYFVLNKINNACFSREQSNVIIDKPKNTTSDNDIDLREWLLIDIDTKRSTGVSATDEEKLNSKETANKVFVFLRDIGFNAPICCDSGNGYHLLYKINLPNDNQSKELLQKLLQVLDLYFTNPKAEIDKSVFNASRITKLYGTFARKGKNTEERPHRESLIKSAPEQIKVTPVDLLKRVADLLPAKEQPTFSNNYGKQAFSLDKFISDHGISVKSKDSYGGGVRYNLECCLFDSSHKGKDACLFQLPNGAIGYKCLHNSCSSYKWQDVRRLFEPGAYDQKTNYKQNRVTEKPTVQPQIKTEDKGNKFIQLSEVKNVDRSKIVSIPSGLIELDRKIIGFNKGEVSIWSGKNASAKSTILNQICLNAINRNYKAIVFSGELTPIRLKNWTHLQAAGRQYTKPTEYENLYFVPFSIGDKIDNWLNDKYFIYNNKYGNEYSQLLIDIESKVVENGIDIVLLDNIMALDFSTESHDKYLSQTKAIINIHKLAEKLNIHIHIVAHPRKAVTFLRKDDISGTADLSNIVDNVFICHRVNNDFIKSAGDFFDMSIVAQYSGYSNVIEVCKNRDLGVMDAMFGFYFEIESKRILNYEHENIVYGWQDIVEEKTIDFNGYAPNEMKPDLEFWEEPTDTNTPF
jgi:hypothetical protein